MTAPFARLPVSEQEAADIANSEWGLKVAAEVQASRADAAAANERAVKAEERAAKMERRWKWLLAAVSLLSALVAPVTVYSIKRMLSGAEARGVAGEREATRLADHAAINELRTGLAEIRGELRTISRLGAVRVQGPAVEPLLPGDP